MTLLCRLTWIAEDAATILWDQNDDVDTWSHDMTASDLSFWLFEYVPTELREKVGFPCLLCAPVCMSG